MHTDTEWIEFWLQQLNPEERARIEAAMSTSERVRQAALETQQALVQFSETVDPMHPTPTLCDRILTSLEDHSRFHAHIKRLSAFLDLPANQVSDLLQAAEFKSDDRSGWQQTGLPGMLALPIQGGPNIADTQAQLLQLAPGFEFPNHRHQGQEWGYVLQGLLLEDSGHEYASGDLVLKDAGSSHRFKVTSSCPALLFVLLEGPIQWLRD